MTRTRSSSSPPTRIRRLAFFRELSPVEAWRLAHAGLMRDLDTGELLATEGTRKQRRILYVVVRGELQYVKRVRGERAQVFLRLRPGDVGGFLTFFNEAPSPVSVVSVGRARVFELGQREFQVLAADDPPLALKLLLALTRDTVRHLDGLLAQAAATSAWALDLAHHLAGLPIGAEPTGG
jgi:CRP-like cAMP-binding protein